MNTNVSLQIFFASELPTAFIAEVGFLASVFANVLLHLVPEVEFAFHKVINPLKNVSGINLLKFRDQT